MDALPTAAVELQGGALASGSGGRNLCAAVLGPLVRTVRAVGVAVAGPESRYAYGVVASEGGAAAGDGRAGGLVAAVVAVGLVVTHEGRRYALAVPAAELGV